LSDPSIQIRVLGSPEVWQQGQWLDGFNSNKTRALLFYLAVTGERHSRDTLEGMFWGETSHERAQTNLRKSLSSLRKMLGDCLEANRQTVYFAPDCFELDIRGLAQALSGSTSDDTRAAELYRGEFLSGFFVADAAEFESWMLDQRMSLRMEMQAVLARLLTAAAQQGRYEQAIEYAQASLAQEPWSEEMHRQLMLLYARSDQRSAALAQFIRCQDILQSELGVQVTRETRALYDRIRTAETTPHNLPAPAYPLTGRLEEIGDLKTTLLHPDLRLVTLTGMGGAGKSRLALDLAWQLRHQFIDGAWWIELANAHTPDDVVSAIAAALNYTFSGRSDPQDELRRYLKNKNSLLVLDNFEQLVETSSAFLGQLLHSGPDLKALVTSRRELNLRQEQIYPLAGLSFPDAEPAPGAGANQEAVPESVKMFEATALRRNARFKLAAARADVDEICQMVEGIPLAIEMAAAHVLHTSPADIATAIQKNIDTLKSTYRDVSERHQSIRAVFNSSWVLLSEPERQAFIRLGAFKGGFSPKAAADIAEVAVAQLNALAGHSLIQRSDTRYSLHELLAQFGRENLGSDSAMAAELRANHMSYYLDLLAEKSSALNTAAGKDARRDLSMDRLNWQDAWDRAAEDAVWPAIERGLDGYTRYMISAGLFKTCEQVLSRIIAQVESQAKHAALRSRLLTAQASLILQVGSPKDALEIARQALTAAEMTEDTDLGIAASNKLIAAQLMIGEAIEEASSLALDVLERARQSENSSLVVELLLSFGTELFYRGSFVEARTYCEEALQVIEREGLLGRKPLAELRLTMIYDSMGEYEASERHLALAQQAADQLDISPVLRRSLSTAWGNAHYRKAEHLLAGEFFENSLAISMELADDFSIAIANANLSNVMEAKGDYPASQSFMQKALDIFRKIGGKFHEGRIQIDLGFRLMATGDYEAGYRELLGSIDVLQSMGADGSVTGAHWRAALLLSQAGQLDKAQAHIDETQSYLEKHPSNEDALGLELASAWLLYYKDDLTSALRRGQAAIELARAHEPNWLPDVFTSLGYIYLAQEDWAQAETVFEEALRHFQLTHQEHFAMECRAGLAAVELGRGQPKPAFEAVQPLLDYLARNQPPNSFHGTWNPFSAYWAVYDALAQNDHPRAEPVFEQASDELVNIYKSLPRDWQRGFRERVDAYHLFLG
jgi:predicted ATPase/DNA-binding SARP family transcriptional activator